MPETSSTSTRTEPSKWEQYWSKIGNETYLMVRVWLEASAALRAEAASWITADDHDLLTLDWAGWFADVEENGRGWSSTEARVFQLTRAVMWAHHHPDDAEEYDAARDRWLTTYPRINLEDVLGGMGSWEDQVLTALVEWATGGRLTVSKATSQ